MFNKSKEAQVIWNEMVSRCYDPADPKFRYWGGVGVTVCDEWLDSDKFEDWYLSNPKRQRDDHELSMNSGLVLKPLSFSQFKIEKSLETPTVEGGIKRYCYFEGVLMRDRDASRRAGYPGYYVGNIRRRGKQPSDKRIQIIY